MVARLRNNSVIGCGIDLTTGRKREYPDPYTLPIGGEAKRQNVTSFSVGANHANFLLHDGSVIAIGSLHEGTLGLESAADFDATGKGKVLSEAIGKDLKGDHIISVSSGAYCGAAVSANGRVWMWGGCAMGECGQGFKSRNNAVPKLVHFPNGEKHFVREAVLSNGASALVTDSRILTAGCTKSIGRPVGEVNETWFAEVPDSATGPVYPLHTVVAASTAFWVLDARRKLWAFGSGLTTVAAGDEALERIVRFSGYFAPFDASIESISTCYDTAFALTSSGTLYTWGYSLHVEQGADNPLPVPITFERAFDSSTSVISRIFQPTGGRLLFFTVEPICETCITTPPGGFSVPIAVSGPTTLIGNITLDDSTSITIDIGGGESGSLLNITGCLHANNSIVNLNIDPSVLSTKGTQSIALLEASCITGGIPTISTKSKPNKSCERMKINSKVETGPSSRSTLVALINIDRSRCHIWWIVVVSVIGGLMALGIVAAMIVQMVVSKRAEEKYVM